MTVGGTDFKINHPSSDFECIQDYYSYKINHLYFRYKVEVCIQKGHIVWMVGHFKPGIYNIIKAFFQEISYNSMREVKVGTNMG